MRPLVWRNALLNTALVVASVVFSLLVAEIGLRFLPVSEVLLSAPVTFNDPVHRFAPNQSIVWSHGWNFDNVNRVRVNNAGFVNGHDYIAGERIISVIGDSYVEASMVAFPETLHGRLSKASELPVYSFAASGAPLSQYLVYAKHASEAYRPEALVFVIVGNDFDESLRRYGASATFQQFSDTGELSLSNEFYPSRRGRLALSSALYRYLFVNVGIQRLWAADPTAMPGRDDGAAFAIQTFFKLLPSYTSLPPSAVYFVIDADRMGIYTGSPSDTYFVRAREIFAAAAREKGYNVVDLDPVFRAHYNANHEHFEFPTDWHWNELGHKVAFEATSAALYGTK